MPKQTTQSGGKRVALLGGGNIGAALAEFIARLASVVHLTIIDPDTFSAANTQSQMATQADVNKPKAIAVAEHCRKIRPDLEVEAVVARVEDAPAAKLRVDAAVAAVDSRLARQIIGRLCWRLGTPLVDSGVHAADLLARVSVFVPGPEQPCIECGFSQRDYDIIGDSYSCAGKLKPTPPTGAAASLGGLAASLAAIELQKLLEGKTDQALVGRQLLFEARRHHAYVSPLRRNSKCRFDHGVWAVESVPMPTVRVGDLVVAGQRLLGGKPVAASVNGRAFIRRLVCRCGNQTPVCRLQGRLATTPCACGREMQPQGFSLMSSLDLAGGDPSPDWRLRDLGVLDGDILQITGVDGRKVYLEVSGL